MELPIVTIQTLDMPIEGEQMRVTIKSHIIKELKAAGAKKMRLQKCGLHLSIDPVFDVDVEKPTAG